MLGICTTASKPFLVVNFKETVARYVWPNTPRKKTKHLSWFLMLKNSDWKIIPTVAYSGEYDSAPWSTAQNLLPPRSNHSRESLTTSENQWPQQRITHHVRESLSTAENQWPQQRIIDHSRESLTTAENHSPRQRIIDHSRESLTTSENHWPQQRIIDHSRESLTTAENH